MGDMADFVLAQAFDGRWCGVCGKRHVDEWDDCYRDEAGQNVRTPATKRPSDVWVDGRGEQWKPEDMSDSHLKNAIGYCRRTGNKALAIYKMMVEELDGRISEDGNGA